jgi:catechol 2,3-dioxygenase-like lactoylglutathione lyase family enzyme
MSEYLISGIQQVGLGVRDLNQSFSWYRRHLGFDIRLLEDREEAGLMLRYTGGEPQERHALLALNLQGGGALEIWQFTRRSPKPPEFAPRLGDLGLFAVRLKARQVEAAQAELASRGLQVLGPPKTDPAGAPVFFLRDGEGLLLEVTEGEGWFAPGKAPTGGVAGCLIGVSDIERSLPLYSGLLGYDRLVYDVRGVFPDLAAVPGGEREVRRVLLAQEPERPGAFGPLLGPSRLELVQALGSRPRRIFQGRYWGDPGLIHLCFDVRGMEALKQELARRGYPFTVDSGGAFAMGEGAGRFAYIEDPDGTLIEFVETYRLALLKSVGWYLDLRRRDPRRALPRWMLRALAMQRVRD